MMSVFTHLHRRVLGRVPHSQFCAYRRSSWSEPESPQAKWAKRARIERRQARHAEEQATEQEMLRQIMAIEDEQKAARAAQEKKAKAKPPPPKTKWMQSCSESSTWTLM